MLRLVLILVLIVLVARAFWRVVDGVIDGLTGRPPRSARDRRAALMVRDPVCGTFVLPERAVALDDGSQRVWFCSPSCRDKYRAKTA
jgi:YHS domain-containing protein